jgi:hypothetical protein
MSHLGAWHRFDGARKFTEVIVFRQNSYSDTLVISTVLSMLLIKVNSFALPENTPVFLPLETIRFYLLLLVVSPYTEMALSVEQLQIENVVHKWLPKQISVISRAIVGW